MRNPTVYYMEGHHSTKVHIRVRKPNGGSIALCGVHSRYSKDLVEGDIFKEFPEHRACKNCAKAAAK